MKIIIEDSGRIVTEYEEICGVYFMYVGDHFYCGRSVNIYTRAWQHEYDKCLLRKAKSKIESVPDKHFFKKSNNSHS